MNPAGLHISPRGSDSVRHTNTEFVQGVVGFGNFGFVVVAGLKTHGAGAGDRLWPSRCYEGGRSGREGRRPTDEG